MIYFFGLFWACNAPKDDSAIIMIDADGDGFFEIDDCDDENAAIHPQAAEICDHLDNNCDGVIDDDSADDAHTWYLDQDGDGYGQSDQSIKACWMPYQYVAYEGD